SRANRASLRGNRRSPEVQGFRADRYRPAVKSERTSGRSPANRPGRRDRGGNGRSTAGGYTLGNQRGGGGNKAPRRTSAQWPQSIAAGRPCAWSNGAFDQSNARCREPYGQHHEYQRFSTERDRLPV